MTTPPQGPWGPGQPWSQNRSGQQPGWQQQGGQQQVRQQPWQFGPGGPNGSGGFGRDKMPLFVVGGVVAVVLVVLVAVLGAKALGGDNKQTGSGTATAQPPADRTTPGSDSSADRSSSSGELGNATGQAKTVTDKLQGSGFQCGDLFNGAQGAHRGCFKYEGPTSSEVVFQFQPDGTIIGVQLKSQDSDNVNNAAITFDAALQAIGIDSFGGSEVAKVQQALKSGQKNGKIRSTWGEFRLGNDGDALQLSGRKSGTDSYQVPRKQFQTTEAQLYAALKAKHYSCTSLCKKSVGKYGSQSIDGYGGSNGGGLSSFNLRASGEAADLKTAMPAAIADGFAVLKGPDVKALKAFATAHADGKSYAGYVAGWRVEIAGNRIASEFGTQIISIRPELFSV
ncbi:MAG TPA: hypothetical protein VGD34_06800 [Kribbella sp.]